MSAQGQNTQTDSCTLPSWRVATVVCKTCKQANAELGSGALGGLWVIFRPKPLPPFPGATGEFLDACHSFLKDRWMLGVTSDKGYLGPPVFDRKKWDSLLTGPEKARCEAMWAGVLPDVFRFTPGQEYEFYFVQHPSHSLAREVQDQLNFGKEPEKVYGAPIELKPDADGRIEIEESPQTFWPSRSWTKEEDKFYGGWCLFNGMPSAHCAPVKEQVIRLQAHLGALRYPVGDHAWPYAFHVFREGEGDFNACPDNDGLFDVRVMNAVFMFQGQARTLRPFQVASKPHETLVDYQKGYASKVTRERRAKKQDVLESDANTFAYLRGKYLDAPFKPAPAGTPDGVVESSTARAIKAWLDNRLRKPGEILVYHRRTWMRPELAKSLYAWHQLALALGSLDGVEFGHAFRQIFHNLDGSVGAGAAVMSPHKTGLAVDMGSPTWMRVYEPNPKRGVVDGRFYWTIFGFSEVACPPANPGAWREELKARLKGHELVGEDELVAYAENKLRLLGVLIQEGQVDAFFRPTATPWLFDPSRDDGGGIVSEPWVPQQCFDESGQFVMYAWFNLEQLVRKQKQIESAIEKVEHDPSPDQARLQALKSEKAKQDAQMEKLNAKISKLKRTTATFTEPSKEQKGAVVRRNVGSFLNLTHVAELVGLHPIRWAPGMECAYNNFNDLNLPAIAKAVSSAAGVPEVASQHPVLVDRGGLSLSFNLAKIDASFMKEWPSLLGKLSSALGPQGKLDPPRFTFAVSADTARAKDVANKLAALLKTSPFAKRCFWAPPPYAGDRAVRTGEEWAAYIVDEMSKKVDDWVKEMSARFRGYGSAPGAEPPLPARAEVEREPDERPPAVGLWTLCLQPVFLRQYTPTEPAIPNEYPFFPGDSVGVPGPGVSRCQEWWHFQREDLLGRKWSDPWELRLPKEKKEETPPWDGVVNDGTWRSLMQMIGWSRECLSDAPSEELYGRRGVGYKNKAL